MARHSDTTPEAAQIQAAVQRKLGSSRRFELACDMSRTVRQIAMARVRTQHPEWDQATVEDQLLWEWYGIRRHRG